MTDQWDNYFVSSSTDCSNDLERWIKKSATINNVKVYSYALLSGFGRGNSFLEYVSQNLADQFLRSVELETILNQMSKLPPNSNMKQIDDQIIALFKTVFINVNGDYYEYYMKQTNRMKSNDEMVSLDSFDSVSLPDPSSNGCSAILAVIINDRLFAGNIGNSTLILCKKTEIEPKEMYIFQLTALHEVKQLYILKGLFRQILDVDKTTDINSLPNRCFGGSAGKQSEMSCEPFIASQGILLDQTTEFLLFASPLAVKIITQLNIENLDNINAYLASLIIGDFEKTGKIQETLHNIVDKLTHHYYSMDNVSRHPPNIALGYVDLHNNNANTTEQPSTDNQSNVETVDSEVDWSEFDTHELRDVFTATVNSLKQPELNSISEH